MPIDRTGVATAAESAALALELLSRVIEVSKPEQRGPWLAAVRGQGEILRRAAQEDVAAYNVYLSCVRNSAPVVELQQAIRGTIEVPLRAARAAMAGLEMCAAMADCVSASVAADLGVAATLLDSAVRGIGLCVDANLRLGTTVEAVGMEQRELEQRAHQAVHGVLDKIAARIA